MTHPSPPTAPGLWVRSTVKEKSLPALRYGRKYSFRIAGVDLAGNSVPDGSDTADNLRRNLAGRCRNTSRRIAGRGQNPRTGRHPRIAAQFTQPIGSRQHRDTGSAIERATASVIEHASSLRRYPQWEDVDLEQLAALFADAEDANVVTVPRLFLRWDPIVAPTLVPREAYTTGESVQRMVIRTGLTSGPGLCQRHIVPPKGSQLEAEQDGRFDELMKTGQKTRAYAIALKERGNLFYKDIQDLNDPTQDSPASRVCKLLSMPQRHRTQDPGRDPGSRGSARQRASTSFTMSTTCCCRTLPDPMADRRGA